MSDKIQIDIETMTEKSMLKFIEIEWNDHFQTRKQTWTALQITGIIAVAVVGAQWKIHSSFASAMLSLLLMAISWFGMQITIKHRRVEVNKFTMIQKFEDKLGFNIISGLSLPKEISYIDVFKNPFSWGKQNTPIFLLRSQFVLHILGWVLFLYNIF